MTYYRLSSDLFLSAGKGLVLDCIVISAIDLRREIARSFLNRLSAHTFRLCS
jgi:hypothetical protein